MALTSPVTGAPVSGLTSPTYTLAQSMSAPNAFSKSWNVTAIGGTQTGVDAASSASRPWTFTVSRPQTLRQLNAVDASGVVRNVQLNTYEITYRKGLTPLAGQASKTSIWKLQMPIPAGADLADVPNIKAMTSCFGGLIYQLGDELADMFVTGEISA